MCPGDFRGLRSALLGVGTGWPQEPPLYHRPFFPITSSQGSSSQHGVRQRALQSLERYFYLVLFNYYLHEQVGLGNEWTHNPFSWGPSRPLHHGDWHGVAKDPDGAGEEHGDVCAGRRGRWVWGGKERPDRVVVLEQVRERAGPPLSALGSSLYP